MELLFKYFPSLSQKQIEQFSSLQEIYSGWNKKINVISRKDIENLNQRHVLHSLAIAKFISFRSGTKIMDLGTGGGFPGIPLAVYFPECRFHLVDSIGKKMKVVEAVKEELQLKNVFTFHGRAEEMNFQYDFVVTRAVAPLAELLKWTKGKYMPKNLNEIPNGLIALKGGNIQSEIADAMLKNVKVVPIQNFFIEEFFGDKQIVFIEQ